MTGEQRGLLIGMILGDGYLYVRDRVDSSGKRITKQELRITHCINQLGYLEYKVRILKSILGGNFNIIKDSAKLNGRNYPNCRIAHSNKYFKFLHRIIYPYGKKTITRQVLDWLTIEGLALWYMDDGNCNVNINKNGWISSCTTIISTCCSYDESITIKDWFLDEHGISVKIFNSKGSYSIRMNTAESYKFVKLINKYIIPEMLYKIRHVTNLNVHECRPRSIPCCICGDPVYDNRRKGMCCKCYTRTMKR